MSTSVVSDHQSPLEAALLDVHATLGELLVAADEQYAAVAERNRERLEGVTRRQEQLSARLERAERKRLELQAKSAETSAPVQVITRAIARRVRELQQRNARAASLLQRSIELNAQSLIFLQRLVMPAQPAYGVKGPAPASRSVLVDSRA